MNDKVLPAEVFDGLVRPLLGRKVAEPWKGYGSAIFLEIGPLRPTDTARRHREGAGCIALEWDWRVEGGRRILFGSSDSRPKIEDGISRLEGAMVQTIGLAGEVPELLIHFDNGHRLRSMAMTTGDPQWTIRLLDGSWIYARDGLLRLGDGTSTATDDDEEAAFAKAEAAATRWGVPVVEPRPGQCRNCDWFIPLDGDGHLLDYGVCGAPGGPLDARAVNRGSGCPSFAKSEG